MARIAFIGLGNMGRPMASNLAKADHDIRGFDAVAAAREAARKDGAEIADDLAAAVAEAEAVITMLPAGKHVREVYEGDGGVFESVKQGTLCIDCSTIDIDSARAVAATAARAGFAMVDAPVSGGVAAASAASLTFMVGGPKPAYQRAAPILAGMGKTTIHVGDAGAGQAAKICNNMLLGISMIGTCEAFNLAKKLGLDPQKFFDVASKASGQCWSLTSYCPVPGPVPASPANRGYAPGFAAAMMLKDLRLAQTAAHGAGAATPLGAEAQALYALFDSMGGGGKDFSAIFEMIEGSSGAAK
jgi:3-hydroxyisobutyrate dehydrogenase